MRSRTQGRGASKVTAVFAVVAFAAIALTVGCFKSKNSASGGGAQVAFKSADEAGAALDQAAKTADLDALTRILGPDAKVLILAGDYETDKAAMDVFVAKYQRMNRWVDMTDGSRVLYIGADNFAFPVPLVKNPSGQWYFDGAAGAREIRAREIGKDELLTIDACYALAKAQEMYYAGRGNAPEYARRIVSTSGNQDGLYWPSPESEDPRSPLGHLSKFPKTSLVSMPADESLTIDGYTLRILTGQGSNAPGGAKGYVVDGKMTDGFAILAVPVKYGETGIMTFQIGPEGIVYERDLGPDTAKTVASIQQYDPDDSWAPVE